MRLQQVLGEISDSPLLTVTAILILCVIFVNGWTDAPNAIASCVATRAMSPRTAIVMAAICNFLGVFVMTALSPRVAETIYNLVDLGKDTHAAQIALSAAMFSIAAWATLAWAFGIPTSESHALLAALTGAAVAMRGDFSGVNGAEWGKAVFGLFFSLLLGFFFGYVVSKTFAAAFKNTARKRANAFFSKGQIVAAAGTAFMHGAQDGQKFIGVFLLGLALSGGTTGTTPVWLMLICALTMGIGTSVGGKKIIKSVGMDMVKIEKYQGFSADVAATAGLFFCSVFGLPVSTTHAKTAALAGAGAARRFKLVDWSVAKEMALTWLLTFPGCGAVGFLATKLFLRVF